MFSVLLFISYVVFLVLDIINDNKIKKSYDYLKYNWNTNPIISIEISLIPEYEIGKITTKEEKLNIYKWKNSYFHFDKLNVFDYNMIYKKENGKLCGKDSFDNNLYFPEAIDCPINDIIIINKNISLKGYKKLPLGDNYTYLFYTNKKTENKIVIDLRTSYKSYKHNIQLNLDKTNDLCYLYHDSKECKDYYELTSSPFYKKIDGSNKDDFIEQNSKIGGGGSINLTSISYLGIDSDIINNRKKIVGFKKSMEIFINIIIFKYISIVINISGFIFIFIFYCRKENYIYQFYISISFLVIIFVIIIIYSISLYINIKYITNFMDKINEDFQSNKNNYISSISIFINEFLRFLYLLLLTIYTYWFKDHCLFERK